MAIAIVDTGPLYAALDAQDKDHAACLEVLRGTNSRLIIPTLVITEVCYLLSRRLGATAESLFVESLQENDVRSPAATDWPRIAELVRQYSNFPLGTVDASLVALAERLDADLLVTLDRRHFSAIRPRHCSHFQLLP